jgi:hypothetical protein
MDELHYLRANPRVAPRTLLEEIEGGLVLVDRVAN